MSNAFRRQPAGYFLFVIILIGIMERGSMGRFSPDTVLNESNFRRYLSFRGCKKVAWLFRSKIYDKKARSSKSEDLLIREEFSSEGFFPRRFRQLMTE